MNTRNLLLALALILASAGAFAAGFVIGCRDGYHETETSHPKAQR